jgi:hypothetical protein
MSSRLVVLIGSADIKLYGGLAKLLNSKEGLRSHLTGIGAENE